MYVRDGLAVNPVTPTTLFAGDYYGRLSGAGVYRSLDGGDSWAVSLPDQNVETLLVHPLTPTLVLAGTREDGLYRSRDNGGSWSPATLPASQVQELAAASVQPGSVYAGAVDELYVSQDEGDSWTLASTLSSTVTALAVHPVTPTQLYAGTRQHGLQRSLDAGTTWLTSTTTGLPSTSWVTSVAFHPITPTILYASTWQGHVYRTFDGGGSWEDLGYLGTVQDVLVHPQEPSIIYAATSNNGLFRGSTLNHLTMEPVADPQYVHRPFTVTLTARDALGFPLTGLDGLTQAAHDDAKLADTLASGGYAGTAVLSATVDAFSPQTVSLVDGEGEAQVAFSEEAKDIVLTAALPEGPAAASDPFDVRWYARTYLPVVSRNAP